MSDFLSGPEQTVGYRYFMGLHCIISHGPVDAVTEIRFGDREAWAGDVQATQSIDVDAPDLFGGDSREGGVVGQFDIEFGDAAQGVNDYLVAQNGSPQPAYRGVLGMVLRGPQLTANNPYIKKMAVRVRRVPKGWNEGEAQIDDGANPAHILRECLTNVAWGMAYPPSVVDETSFAAASSVLVSENFGLSFIWTQQTTIRDFVQQVLDHIGGVLNLSPSSGQFELKLIRDDYDPATLPVLDEDNIVALESFQRAGWGETINELSVVYTRPENMEEAQVTVQDLGNLQIQGPVTETRRYPGITDDDLAARVAMRDLTSISRPLAQLTIEVNRTAWNLLPGEVFKFSWAPLGVVELVARVANINTGSIQNNTIRIQAIEDTWAFRDNAYTEPEPIGWTDPSEGDPQNVEPRLLTETSYWELSQTLPQNLLDDLDVIATFAQSLGGRPSNSGVTLDYELRTGSGSGLTSRGGASFVPNAVIVETLRPEWNTSITFTGGVDMSQLQVGDWCYIEDGGNNNVRPEAVEITALDVAAGTMDIERGLIDTVPLAWPAGSIIWGAKRFIKGEGVERTESETVFAKLLTRTTRGQLDEDDAAQEVKGPLDNRKQRPYPPGNVRVDGAPYPGSFSATLNLTWSHRDRLSQTSSIPRQSDGNIGPEANTEYTVRIYGETGTLQHTAAGLTGTSYDYTTAQDIADNGLGRASTQLTVELESRRTTDGRTSYHTHRFTVVRNEAAGYGLQYGFNYGGPPP